MSGYWGFWGALSGVVWAICVFGCWWFARNSAHSRGWAVFWGIVASIIALPFYAIFYYRDRDKVPIEERISLSLTGGGSGRREKACLKCGTIVPGETSFCPSCGNDFPKTPPV